MHNIDAEFFVGKKKFRNFTFEKFRHQKYFQSLIQQTHMFAGNFEEETLKPEMFGWNPWILLSVGPPRADYVF